MNKRERIETVFLYGIFTCYILLLIKILFLSRISLLELFSSQREWNRSINLIPFYSIIEYMLGGSEIVKRFAFGNVVGNIAIFIPLGVYLTLFKKDKRISINLPLILIVSLLFETIQFVFAIGAFDIDDIILNCLGGWTGILGHHLLSFVLRDEKKVYTTIAIVSTILGLPIMLYLLFMIKMRF